MRPDWGSEGMEWTADWDASAWDAAAWDAWDAVIEMTGRPSVHLDSRCARALLQSKSRQVAALRWWKGTGELAGVALVEDAYAESRNLENHLEADSALFSWAVRWLHGEASKLRFPLRVMGPVLGSGDHAFRFVPDVPVEEAKRLATSALQALPIQNGFKPRAFLIKDFPAIDAPERIAGGSMWMKSWTDLEFDPLMRIPVNPDWKELDGYMSELKTKARTKVKRILTCSGDCEIEELTAEELTAHAPALIRLYRLIYAEAGFRLGELSVEDLLETKSAWADHFRVSVLKIQGELLGFQCGFLTPHTVEAFFVGFDRDQHKELALYQRMLVEFIRWGIESGAKEVVMGRTALAIKSSVGALPERLSCVVRFRNPILNFLARAAAQFSHPVHPQLKRPWKQDAFPMHSEVEVSSEVHAAVHAPAAEAFPTT